MEEGGVVHMQGAGGWEGAIGMARVFLSFRAINKSREEKRILSRLGSRREARPQPGKWLGCVGARTA
jgi:hypothetical protein